MDKPVSLWFVFFTIFVLVGGSYLIYLWLKNITKIKDDNDSERSIEFIKRRNKRT